MTNPFLLSILAHSSRYDGHLNQIPVRFSSLIPKMLMFTLTISCLNTYNLSWFMNSNIRGSCAILLFTSSDFTSITSHIHRWVLFLLWLCLFILSGVISPLISSSILGTYWSGSSSFRVLSFCLFTLFMGFSRQEYWSGLPFPSPVDHILSELPYPKPFKKQFLPLSINSLKSLSSSETNTKETSKKISFLSLSPVIIGLFPSSPPIYSFQGFLCILWLLQFHYSVSSFCFCGLDLV